jgi:glycosyltransferase involved in cell wall biosynthesis
LVTGRPRLLFVSARYLLPPDSGGKIRTGQILRGLKGGRFEIVLASPAPPGAARDKDALAQLCDRFASWPEPARSPWFHYTRMRHIVSSLPIPIATDISAPARRLIQSELDLKPDLVVVDFVHAHILMPQRIPVPSVMFTHNVEAEIFARHHQVATNPIHRAIWRDQLGKMRRFEAKTLAGYGKVIAVSERDAKQFRESYGVAADVIATGVDLEFLHYAPEKEAGAATIVFTAAMDSFANIDGVQWFMDEVWPLIAARNPAVRFVVAGKNPDAKLVRQAKERALPFTFTGFVDDVRPYVHDAAVYVIPLRVGGGTRIKGYEAMALGRAVVSTTLGVEGLQLEPGKHYLAADTPQEFADAVLRLLEDAALRHKIAQDARGFVETRFSFEGVAKSFEAICAGALTR